MPKTDTMLCLHLSRMNGYFLQVMFIITALGTTLLRAIIREEYHEALNEISFINERKQ